MNIFEIFFKSEKYLYNNKIMDKNRDCKKDIINIFALSNFIIYR